MASFYGGGYGYGDYYGGYSYSNPYETMGIIFLVCAFIALTLTILAFVFLLPEKNRQKLNSFFRFVADVFNFKSLVLEKILKFFYTFTTILLIIGGFITLLYSMFADYANGEIAGTALMLMVVAPILLRIIYEAIMLTILGVKNIMQINNKLKNQNDDNKNTSPFDYKYEKIIPKTNQAPNIQQPYAPSATVVNETPVVNEGEKAQAEPVIRFCTNCGTKYDASKEKCPNGCQE